MKYLLFDLDGTLTEPKAGITKSIQYALKCSNIIIDDPDVLAEHIGPPLKDVFMGSYGLEEEDADKAIIYYREYFEEYGMYDNEVYKGIERLLQKLRDEEKIMIVATSKPEKFARMILEHFSLAEYFEDICGATMDGSRSKKEDVIRYALTKNGISDAAQAVMIGDRMYDIVGAKQVGLISIGVLYGYGSRNEIEEAQADYIVGTTMELYDTIMGLG